MNFRAAIISISLLASAPGHSTDIASKVHQSTAGYSSYAEFGISVVTAKLPLVGFNDRQIIDSADPINSLHIGFAGRFQYKNFFVEAIENSFSNLTLGYNLYESDTTEHELIITQLLGETERSDVVGFETINDRKEDINVGIRSSHYFDSNILQFELVSDVNDSHKGIIAALQFGRQHQYRNWNLHGLAGIRYFSENVIDHHFGVSADEATDSVSAYQAKDGYMPTLQLGAAIPINEKWVFRSVAEYSRLPGAVADSPLAQGDDTYLVQAGIYRVLGGS